MSNAISLFYETAIFEAKIPKDPEIGKIVNNTDSVKRIIDLSTKYFSSGLSKDEYKESQELFKDPKIERLLEAAVKVGQRNGWISGSLFGSMFGALTGGVLAITGASPFFALVLVGATIGGLSIGYVSSKIVGVLTRWETENNITSGKGARILT